MKIIGNHTTLFILFWRISCIFSQCQFPYFLVSKPRWESQVALQRQFIGEFWMFKSQTAESIDATKAEREPITYTCHAEYSNHRYILSYEDESLKGQMSFVCFQFVHRSENIVQIKRSSVSIGVHNEGMCQESLLTLDPHPLVWPQPIVAHPIPEALKGGFEFSVVDRGSNLNLCETSSLMPNWEADCMKEDGIQVDFRQFQCRADLEMQVIQKLHSLGSWNQGSYTFTVITDLDELWPRLWMIKSPTTPLYSDQFEVELLTSITAQEATEHLGAGRYTLRMKKVRYSSLCANEDKNCESGECEQISKGSNLYCQQTCEIKNCRKLADEPPCSFEKQNLGEWFEYEQNVTTSMNLTEHVLSLSGYLPRTCLDLRTQIWYEGFNKRTLVTSFSNGCRARYQCIEFSAKSDAVMQVQISQPTIWPRPLPVDPTEICAPNKYDDSLLSGIFKTELHPYGWKTLIKSGSTQPIQNCGLTGKLHLFSSTTTDGPCAAELIVCESDGKSFEYRALKCGSNAAVQETHGCLASFTTNDKGFNRHILTVVMTRNGNSLLVSPEYRCWMLHKNIYDSTTRLFIAPPAECHMDLANDIMYRNFTGYYARFDLNTFPENYGSFGCKLDHNNTASFVNVNIVIISISAIHMFK